MLQNLLFPWLRNGKWARANVAELYERLPVDSLDKSPAIDPEWCRGMMESLHAELGVDFTFGGYMEDRSKLWKGHYHKPDQMMHLGIDYNVPADVPVYTPVGGRVVLLEEDPDQGGGWGSRLILKVNENLFVIFAHLYQVHGLLGRNIGKGEPIGLVAPSDKNGGWYPHLHVQCMRKYDRAADGYGANSPQTVHDFPDPEIALADV